MSTSNEKIKPNELSASTKASMLTRIVAALIGCVIIVPPSILGDWFIFALAAVVLTIALVEIVNTAKKDYSVILYVMTLLVGYLMTFWPVIQALVLKVYAPDVVGEFSPHIYSYFGNLSLCIPAIFVGVCLLFLTAVLHPSFTVKDVCFLVTMVLITSLGIQSLIYIRLLPSSINEAERPFFNDFDNFKSCTFFVYVMLGAFATDIGAYFTGLFFGHKKINERISPKKTYGGFIGGLVISGLVTAGFAFALCATGHPLLSGYIDMEHWYNIVVISLGMPIIATLGDFVFSAIKREYGIKDFGKLIPGHGGILDRLDSLMFTFLFAAVYISVIIAIFGDSVII